jgi:hypothetical protein
MSATNIEGLGIIPRLDFSRGFDEAKKFLEVLDGKKGRKFHFQTFLDLKIPSEELRKWPKAKRAALNRLRKRCTRVFYGTLDELLPKLVRLNEIGAGIYVTINECKPGGTRTADDVISLRSVFIDKDDRKALREYSPNPPLIVQSRNGPQAYWPLTIGETLERFGAAQKALSEHFESDGVVTDLCRVMRVPGFYHLKEWVNPFLIQLVRAEELRFTIDEVLAGIPTKSRQQVVIGTEQVQLPVEASDQRWRFGYDCDLRTLDAVALFKDCGMYFRPLGGEKHAVRCPQHELHTTGQEGDTSSVIFQSGSAVPGFKCQHAHCAGFGTREVFAFFGKETIEKYSMTYAQAARRAVREGRKPELFTSGLQQREIIEVGWEVILSHNEEDPRLFLRGNVIVEPSLSSDGGGGLVEMTRDRIMGFLIRSANVFKFTSKGKAVPGTLPDFVPRDMVSIPDTRLPTLDTITGSPFFRADGTPVSNAGFDLESACYLHHPKGFPPLEEIPLLSKTEARRRIKWLTTELLSDFPFTSEADRTHAVATLLLPFIRRMVEGPTPLALFNAPLAGSGKTLLAKLISVIVLGHEIPVQVLSGNEEERRKMLLAELIQGRPIALLDNLDDEPNHGRPRAGGDKLHSPCLAAVLTSTEYTDRLLSVSRKVTVKNNTAWILTGNNPQLSVELQRRCVSVRLEPEQEKPWERRKFRHADILRWTRENRGKLLEAILSSIQSWVVAGMPPVEGKSLGSYESWSDTMRSLLGYLDLNGFLENQKDVEYATDPIREIWNEIVARWHQAHGSKQVSAEQLLLLGRDDGLFDPLLPAISEGSQKFELGRLVSKQIGRIYRGFKIVRLDNPKTGHRYALVQAAQAEGGSREIRGDKTGLEGKRSMSGENG